MRTIAFLGIAAAMAIRPAIAESAPGDASVAVADDWSSVPTIALKPPVEAAPQGNWSRDGGWAGERHSSPPQSGQWRGERHGFENFRPRRGLFMPRLFVSPPYFVWNWRSYGLPEPGHGQRWVRYYDDAVLIDERGYIHDAVAGVDWEGYGPGPSRDDRDDEAARWAWGGPYAYSPRVYYAPAGATTTVIVHGAPVVTTTTTTHVEEQAVPVRRKARKSRAKCACK